LALQYCSEVVTRQRRAWEEISICRRFLPNLTIRWGNS
jgi:hypothetical protein